MVGLVTSRLLSCLLLCAIACIPLHAHALPSLTLEASPHRVNGKLPGRTTLTVSVSGLKDGDPDRLLAAFHFELLYDPTFLQLGGGPGGYGSALGSPALGQAIVSTTFSDAGSRKAIAFSEVSLLEADPSDCAFCAGPLLSSLQSDSFELVRLTMLTLPQAIFPGPNGTGNLTTFVVVRDIDFGNQRGDPIALQSRLASVSVTFVQEPPIWALLLGALLVPATFRRLYAR